MLGLQDKFKELTTWWKEVLGTSVTGVTVSKRLAKSPAIVVTSQYGWSANMERIMKSQVHHSWLFQGLVSALGACARLPQRCTAGACRAP